MTDKTSVNYYSPLFAVWRQSCCTNLFWKDTDSVLDSKCQ